MENLFSYGTLQLAKVQQQVFGRTIQMYLDDLVGYQKEKIKIEVQSALGLSGEEEHVIINYTGNDSDIIEGAVLSITEDELRHADEYETDDYKRVEVRLRSGKSAWVYVKNDKE